MRWAALPWEAEGIGVRELALLAVHAMRASSFSRSLQLDTEQEYVRASFGAACPREIAALHFSDFHFEEKAAHASLHGKWRAGEARRRDCVFEIVYWHDMSKVKTA
mgnify:FL=1|tara:strand:+ start:272 stop:589 length:318 start_codon:yes stop_codon:yes gene_type:complete